MESGQLRRVSAGAAIIAIMMAITTRRLPRWLRIAAVTAAVTLAAGAGLFAYRYFTQPQVLTVATGSIGGDVTRFMIAIAGRLAETQSPVRLKVVDKGTAPEATKAFSAGEVDLVVGRADAVGLSAARVVVVLTHAVVLIVAPPGSQLTDIEDLKGKTVRVVGGPVNRQLVDVLKKEYGLDRAKVQFKDLTYPDIPQALKSKQVSALLLVMPISEKYLSMLRDLFPNPKQKVGLIAIESAGAIAAVNKAYESYDLPKGTIKGSPAVPDDDLTTLRVPLYLFAKKTLDDEKAGVLAKAIIDTRRDLVGEFPALAAQMSAPSTEKDAYIPTHPGAAAYYSGDTKSFFDKYGDQFFYGSMLFGSLVSLFAAVWKFMTKDSSSPESRPLARLYGLSDMVKDAENASELANIEEQIDQILRVELGRLGGNLDSGDAVAMYLVTQRLERLINMRRARLVEDVSTFP
jgi:TRAP transporter TAXI family solute receptor